MIAEEHAPAGRVEWYEVHHQVGRRRRGRHRTEQRQTRLNPVRDAGLVGRLLCVNRAYPRREPADHDAQAVACH